MSNYIPKIPKAANKPLRGAPPKRPEDRRVMFAARVSPKTLAVLTTHQISAGRLLDEIVAEWVMTLEN